MFARTLTPVSLALALLVAAPLAGTDLAFAQAQPTAAAAKGVVHKFTMTTGMAGGKMVYLDEKGAANPVLRVNVGDTVEITIGSREGAEHDIVVPDLGVKSKAFNAQTGPTKVSFKATKAGKFTYFCSVPGHRQIGMEGVIEVTGSANASGAGAAPAPGSPPPPNRRLPRAPLLRRQPRLHPWQGWRLQPLTRSALPWTPTRCLPRWRTARLSWSSTTLKPWSSRASSMTAPRSPTGPSTRRCPAPCCASSKATRWS